MALSRARLGLYILGNADDLSSQSPEWRKIIGHLKLSDALGGAIPLACQLHPNIEQLVSDPGDFLRFAPDGVQSPLIIRLDYLPIDYQVDVYSPVTLCSLAAILVPRRSAPLSRPAQFLTGD